MKKIIVLVLVICFVLPVGVSYAKRLHSEKWYQDRVCMSYGGQAEVVLQDKTRCDCLTDTHAIEFDFGSKWAESIGQSLYYSVQTGKRAGIVLILEKENDLKYYERVEKVIEYFDLPVDVWMVKP
jgi:hypothetical protein